MLKRTSAVACHIHKIIRIVPSMSIQSYIFTLAFMAGNRKGDYRQLRIQLNIDMQKQVAYIAFGANHAIMIATGLTAELSTAIQTTLELAVCDEESRDMDIIDYTQVINAITTILNAQQRQIEETGHNTLLTMFSAIETFCDYPDLTTEQKDEINRVKAVCEKWQQVVHARIRLELQTSAQALFDELLHLAK